MSKGIPLIVFCGSSVECGAPQFWALDTSCTRLFVLPESTRVDVIHDMLVDFIGKTSTMMVDLRFTKGSARAKKIFDYIDNRFKPTIDINAED